MSGDPIDLDAIEARADDFPRYGLTGSDRQLIDEDVPALVAEVRRLRDLVEWASEIHAPQAGDGREICYECETAYPCPTAAALAGVAWGTGR